MGKRVRSDQLSKLLLPAVQHQIQIQFCKYKNLPNMPKEIITSDYLIPVL